MSSIINNYAFAWYESLSSKNADDVYAQCDVVVDFFSSQSLLSNVISDLFVPNKKKLDMVKTVVEKLKVDRSFYTMFDFLLKHKRCSYWAEVVNGFKSLYMKLRKIGRLEIVSCIEMDSNVANRIKDRVMNRFGMTDVIVVHKIDKAIIGGFVLIFNDIMVIDYSIIGKLKRMSRLI